MYANFYYYYTEENKSKSLLHVLLLRRELKKIFIIISQKETYANLNYCYIEEAQIIIAQIFITITKKRS